VYGVEIAYYGGEELRALCHGHNELAIIYVDLDLARTVRAQRLGSYIQVSPARQRELEPLTTNLCFQFVSRASSNHAPQIHNDDLISKVIGFLQVLGGE